VQHPQGRYTALVPLGVYVEKPGNAATGHLERFNPVFRSKVSICNISIQWCSPLKSSQQLKQLYTDA
jgi:hypothetical protein